MEYGFVSLCNKNDKELMGLLKESNNIDYLGLRRMNVRLSNLMFPFANTLMPNLVYFYYLHAIYYAVLSGDENKNREPTKEQIDEINKLEEIISKSIRNLPDAKGKGFFGDVKARAYGKYKNSMKLMHFFDSEWIPTFGTTEQKANWKDYNKTLHGYLSLSDRFKFVQELAKSADRDKMLVDKLENKPAWLWQLDDIEKRDFIWRVIDPYGPEQGTITKHSVFSNVVMYYCGIQNKPGQWNETIYKNDYSVNIEDKIKIENLYFSGKEINKKVYTSGLKDILENAKVRDGWSGNKYSKVNQLPVFGVAEEYSKLQLVAKLAYNMCLFEKNEEKKNEYKAQLEEKIKHYKDSMTSNGSKSKKSNIKVTNGDDYASVFFNKDDVALKEAFTLIRNISDAILAKNSNIENIIEKIVELVKERELEVLGGNSRLDSGMAFDAMGDYEDTFRWEYRPEIERMEVQESCDKDTINDLGKDKVDESNADEINEENAKDKNRLHNMCARYYIYELFFEK